MELDSELRGGKVGKRRAKKLWQKVGLVIGGIVVVTVAGWFVYQFVLFPGDTDEIGELTTVEDWREALPKIKARAERASATREDKEKYGQALRVLGDLDGAIEVYKGLDDALSLGNMYRDKAAKAKVIKGENAAEVKEYLDKAVEYYRKAIDKNTEETAAVVNLASILEERGEADEAVEVYVDAILKATKDVSLEMLKAQLGRLYDRLGRADEARAMYLEVLELNPNNQMAKNGLGE